MDSFKEKNQYLIWLKLTYIHAIKIEWIFKAKNNHYLIFSPLFLGFMIQ